MTTKGPAASSEVVMVPIGPIDYHRRFVSAVLDAGVDQASPLQIYEHMTLTKDPDRPTFQNLKLEQIKSHLQRFRKVYKNEGHHHNPKPTKRGRHNNHEGVSADGDALNAEKQGFLDDYDSFVDFGLDAAAARNDENHKSIVGGRAIGLVSQLVMINERVNICHFCKIPNSTNGESDVNRNRSRSPSERRNLDKKIPKLTPSEEISALGRSITLVVGLLEHLNNYITTERQNHQQQQGYESDISSLENASRENVLINNQSDSRDAGLDGGTDDSKDTRQGLPLLERISFLPLLPPLSEAGHVMQQHMLPHPSLFHPNIAEQLLKQQQQKQKRKESLTSDPDNAGQFNADEFQKRRERQYSFSDVSSIGENLQSDADEVVQTYFVQQPKPQKELRRLGKFHPVKNIKLQDRIHPPKIYYGQQGRQQQYPHQYQHQQQHLQHQQHLHRKLVPPVLVPSLLTIESFDIPSPAERPKPLVEVPPQPVSVLATTAALARHFTMASLKSQQQQHSHHQQQLQQQHQLQQHHQQQQQSKKQQQSQQHLQWRLSGRQQQAPAAPPPIFLPRPSPRKRKRILRHLTKENMFQKLQRAIVYSSIIDSTSSTYRKYNTTNDDCSSVVSSLSSSGSDSDDFDDAHRPSFATRVLEQPKQQHQQQNEGRGIMSVSVDNTTSATMTCNEINRSTENNDDDIDEEELWIFDRFSIPLDLRLKLRSQHRQQPPKQLQQQQNHHNNHNSSRPHTSQRCESDNDHCDDNNRYEREHDDGWTSDGSSSSCSSSCSCASSCNCPGWRRTQR